MRNFIKKCNMKCKEFALWIWAQCKDVKTLILLLVVCLVLFSPTIVLGILGFVFDWGWAIAVASAYWAFWLGPFSPFFVIAVSITLSIKRILQVIFKRKSKTDESEAEASSTEPLSLEAAENAQDAEETEVAENAQGAESLSEAEASLKE